MPAESQCRNKRGSEPEEGRVEGFARRMRAVVDDMLARPGAMFDRAHLGELAHLLDADAWEAAAAYEALCWAQVAPTPPNGRPA
ncbi:MAG: hypothetical protein ABR540_11095 [Acidimicrobiales bacterium]